MLSFSDALDRVLNQVEVLGLERAALRAAHGRVLGADVVATEALPRFDYSAMDGYAVHSNDFGGAGPWQVPVRGESRAGGVATQLERGTACRIFTGAALPGGADAVVINEDTEPSPAGTSAVLMKQAPQRFENVRRRGEDLAAGDVALRAGTRLNAYHLGLAASLDRVELSVARRPRVSIVCTGDELRVPGAGGSPRSVPESNGLTIALLAERAGAIAELLPIGGDDMDAMRDSFARALRSTDVLITVGGVSVGDYDLVRPALSAAGAELDFWKVAIKPGKPLAYGTAGAARVLGLPGNPVSAQVTFALFGLPLLRALQGESEPRPRFQRARLLAPIEQRPGRLGFYRARWSGDGVMPLSNQASGNVVSLAHADVLIAVAAESSGHDAGEIVDVLKLGEL